MDFTFRFLLIEEMAVNRFRLIRLHSAEVAILAAQRLTTEFKLKGLMQASENGLDNLMIQNFGLTASTSDDKYVQMLELSKAIGDRVRNEGFTKQGLELLKTLYGHGPNVAGSRLLAQLKAELGSERWKSDGPLDECDETALANFCEALDREVQNISREVQVLVRARAGPIPNSLLASFLLAPPEQLDSIMRYEVHLEEQFQIKLDQLESKRRPFSTARAQSAVE